MGQIVETTKRRKWRGNKYIWILVSVVTVSALLYWEQTALLYVISTLILTVLLLVVAFSDLEGKDWELNQPTETQSAAASESPNRPQSQAVIHSHSISERSGKS
jgi:hypothetical protein